MLTDILTKDVVRLDVEGLTTPEASPKRGE